MEKYILGVDGGGTKTNCYVCDLDMQPVHTIEWGPTNHEGMDNGFDEFRIVIDNMLKSALDDNGISRAQIVASGWGMAGVDTNKQQQIISGIIRDLGMQNAAVCNDAYLGVYAGAECGYGVCLICGTGNTAAGINTDGRMFQVGGQGGFTGDIGGGDDVAFFGIKAAYNSLFRMGKQTILADKLFALLGITSKYDFMQVLPEAVVSGALPTSDICKLVFDCANLGDAAALEILNHIGAENAKTVGGLINELSFPEDITIPIIMAGSVNVKCANKTAVERFKHDLSAIRQNLEFIILSQPPVIGAVRLAALQRRTSCTSHT